MMNEGQGLSEQEFQYQQIVSLQSKIKGLQEDLKNYEELVRLNMEALHIAVTKPSEDDELGAKSPQSREFFETFESTFQSNLSLLKAIDKMKRERNLCQSKAFIHELIAEDSHKNEAEMVEELEEKIADLRSAIYDKENTMRELEKTKTLVENDGSSVKYREIPSQEEQATKLKRQMKKIRRSTAGAAKQLEKLRAENIELRNNNVNLGQELSKIKATMATHNKRRADLDTSAFFHYDPDASFGHREPRSAMLAPQPVNEVRKEEKPRGRSEKILPPSLKVSVPKLDLSKALKIQELATKKMNDNNGAAEDPAQEAKLLEQVKKMELEYKDAKKELEKTSLSNKLIAEEIDCLQRANNEVLAANELLIRSNKGYEAKWQKLYFTLEFHRDFYNKYLGLLQGRRDLNRSFSAQLLDPASSELINDVEVFKLLQEKLDVDLTPDSLANPKRKGEVEEHHVNISVLEVDDNYYANPTGPGQDSTSALTMCKSYLQSMAAELNQHLLQRRTRVETCYRQIRRNPSSLISPKGPGSIALDSLERPLPQVGNAPVKQRMFCKEAEDVNQALIASILQLLPHDS
eukprot:TRINITY_DN3562_c0_g2_i1.p1 TRINITY_DN3562_c0_g2~~TRINITY_DN3562_c0_g2_i1.p1  ORF type:complete len:577 (-),score=183.04 TRINITY_DN3562_c0_g2_i1:109-1839(-)